MALKMLHIFRNTPFGRETLLQSCYFCRTVEIALSVYIPTQKQFLMYFDNDAVQIDLDSSYLYSPESARTHASVILAKGNVEANFIAPPSFTASTLPDIPTKFDFMCCPRSVSDMSSKISLGHIGTRVRRILNTAHFPVLLTSALFKEWKSLACFFGGSANSIKALRLALRISRTSDIPLELITQDEKKGQNFYRTILRQAGLEDDVENHVRNWHFFQSGSLQENLYDVPHDSLAVAGTQGHSALKDIMFGTKMEMLQSHLPNPMLAVGPNCRLPVL
jgi:hypothetical protein